MSTRSEPKTVPIFYRTQISRSLWLREICLPRPYRLSPMARRTKIQSFFPATCASKKILLRLQVWNLCASGAQIMRAADCKLFVKKAMLFDNLSSRSLWLRELAFFMPAAPAAGYRPHRRAPCSAGKRSYPVSRAWTRR